MKTIGNEQIDVGLIKTYKRSSSIAFYNPKDQQQYIAVTEDIVIDGDVNSGNLNITTGNSKNIIINVDGNLSIPMIDSKTGKPTGKNIDINEVGNILFSIYFYATNLNEVE